MLTARGKFRPERLTGLFSAVLLAFYSTVVFAKAPLTDTQPFVEGYSRQIRALEARPLSLQRLKLHEEIEILFMGGRLQPANFEGPVDRLERAALEALRADCCPNLKECVDPLDSAANRERLGGALATAAALTGASDDPFTLGRAAGAFGHLLRAVPASCACASSSVDTIVACAGRD